MAEYIIRDLTAVSCFLPYGLVAGVITYIVLKVVNKNRITKEKQPLSVAALTAFVTYLVIVLCITFWSRESGESTGIDLKLGSTWAINNRNKAFVIENILLFIPYGIVAPWAFLSQRDWFSNILLGLITSTGIECMQLLTGKGFFQLDDILTNTLGMMVGYIVFSICNNLYRIRRSNIHA